VNEYLYSAVKRDCGTSPWNRVCVHWIRLIHINASIITNESLVSQGTSVTFRGTSCNQSIWTWCPDSTVRARGTPKIRVKLCSKAICYMVGLSRCSERSTLQGFSLNLFILTRHIQAVYALYGV